MTITVERADIEGWQELTTPDGLRIVGCMGAAWYVLGPLNSVIAAYPATITISQALKRYRDERAERTQRSAMD